MCNTRVYPPRLIGCTTTRSFLPLLFLDEVMWKVPLMFLWWIESENGSFPYMSYSTSNVHTLLLDAVCDCNMYLTLHYHILCYACSRPTISQQPERCIQKYEKGGNRLPCTLIYCQTSIVTSYSRSVYSSSGLSHFCIYRLSHNSTYMKHNSYDIKMSL